MKIFFWLVLLGLGNSVKGQELKIQREQAKLLTHFPFRMATGGIIMIHAKFGNIPDSLNFILDTGSGGISLDSSTCADFNIIPDTSDRIITGMGGSRKAKFIKNQELHIPGLTIDNLDFHVNDYEILTQSYGEKIDGIIGYSFFSRYIAKINFDSLFISIFTPGEMTYPKGGELLNPFFTLLPYHNFCVRDKTKVSYNFLLDTGAGLCFLMSESFANEKTILKKKRKPVTTQAEGLGGKLEMKLTIVKKVEIGNYKFYNVPTYIFKDEFNVTAYPNTGGLIGNDLLRRFNLIINYPQKEFHLLPNTHFNESFDYAYTGMAIYFVDGRIYVEDVIGGSPADKAGIKVDDIVIGVAGNFTNNITQYKNLLQNTNGKLKVIINRNGKLIELYLKPKSIL
jgi:predicted aspartyl protease